MALSCLTDPHAHLQATLEEGILELVLNRPERKNALFSDFYLAIEQALLEAETDKSVRVVLLRGVADDFSAGNDMQDFAKGNLGGIDAPPFRLLRAAASLSKPLLIAVKGVAIGIGTTLLLHADMVFADSKARFQMPFASLGLSPEGCASLLLPRMAGYHKAAELLMLAEPFDAQTALQAGIVNAVVDDVYAYTRQKAARLVELPAVSLQLTKQLLKQTEPAQVIDRINQEAELFMQRVASAEMKEAVTAFMQKRKPDFRQFDR